MKTIQIKGFRLEISTVDGRGAGDIKGYTTDKNLAIAWTKISAWHTYFEVNQVFHFVDSLDELNDVEKEKKKQRALDKLTKQEKELLGLA